MEKTTVKETSECVKRFLEKSGYQVSYDSIKDYLQVYINNPPKTYNSQVTNLRRFVRDYLKAPDLIMSFKMAAVDEDHLWEDLPTKDQVLKGFQGLQDSRARALYLFTATTGLRKSEILHLLKSQVDLETHAVIPRHFTRKKRSGITFYTSEAAVYLQEYLASRTDNSEKLFVISERAWRKIWRSASRSAGVKISAKVFRAWFSSEMGELGVQDRYVDVYQGRAPRSVLAKHYTGKGLERLKRIYERAGLKVLSSVSNRE